MSDPTDNVVDLVDHEEAIFRARLAGKSVRRIAHEFRCDVARVQAIIERMCTPVSVQMRRHALELDLERLDELQAVFYQNALGGDPAAAAITLKIAERRASLLGLDVPAAIRTDPVQVAVAATPETSTERIMRALDALAAERPAVESSTGNGGPEPDGSGVVIMQK